MRKLSDGSDCTAENLAKLLDYESFKSLKRFESLTGLVGVLGPDQYKRWWQDFYNVKLAQKNKSNYLYAEYRRIRRAINQVAKNEALAEKQTRSDRHKYIAEHSKPLREERDRKIAEITDRYNSAMSDLTATYDRDHPPALTLTDKVGLEGQLKKKVDECRAAKVEAESNELKFFERLIAEINASDEV